LAAPGVLADATQPLRVRLGWSFTKCLRTAWAAAKIRRGAPLVLAKAAA
jgi:hypothetical protein